MPLPARTDTTMSWSDLPAELLTAIADGIGKHDDFARFRAVCPSWRSASEVPAACRRARAPLLLLPARGAYEWPRPVDRRLWSLVDGSITKIHVPAASCRPFLFASPQGWTLAVGYYSSATLLHPFTGASADLPELPSWFGEKTIRDMVWDRSPRTVMIGLANNPFGRFHAFFCRLGDESWSPLQCADLAQVSNVTYCDGAFYLFDGDTRKTVTVDSEAFAVTAVIEPPTLEIPEHLRRGRTQSTLVVSSDELLVIVRSHLLIRASFYVSGELFRAFRADRRRMPMRWEEVADIGDRAVFVDHLRAFCVEADGLNGVRRNCMYVASSYEDADMKDGMGNLRNHSSTTCWQWPSWSMPNLL